MPLSLLLIDDDATLCEILAEALAGSGFEVTRAMESESAFALLLQRRYQAVVCDQNLGAGATGTRLLQRAHQAGLLEHTACVLMTGLPPSDAPAGITVMMKPFDLWQLVTAIQSAVREV